MASRDLFYAQGLPSYSMAIRAGRYQKNDDGTVLVQNITVLLNITVLHKSLLHTLLSL